MVFISHHDLPYETSFTQIGLLLWKFTIWGKRFPPMGERGLTMGEKLYHVFFISHHDLPYETSFTQIGLLFWKFTFWGKTFFPHGGKGVEVSVSDNTKRAQLDQIWDRMASECGQTDRQTDDGHFSFEFPPQGSFD